MEPSHLGWLIDPDEKLVFVYFADRMVSVFTAPDDRLPVPTFAQTLSLTVEQIFGWLEDAAQVFSARYFSRMICVELDSFTSSASR